MAKWERVEEKEFADFGLNAEVNGTKVEALFVGGIKVTEGPYGSGVAVWKRARTTRYGVSASVPAAKDQPVYLEFDNETDAQVQADEWRNAGVFANVTIEPRSVFA